jgi:hypothetical protein
MARRFTQLLAAFCLIGALPQAGHALSVTQPTSATVVPAGDDYATQVLGNAWDMNDAVDVDTEESFNVTSQAFGSGIFSGLTTAADANIYPLFEGQLSSINISRGATFPVDTSHYRYLTVKMKATQPSSATEFSRVVFYQVNGTFGLGIYHALPNNANFIFTNDMLTQIDGTSPHQWTDFPQVTGLRIDPATPGGAFTTGSQFSIDWIRLTAPATAAQKTPVTWTDAGAPGGSTYDLVAVDASGTTFSLGNTGAVTSFQADTSFLAPGQYTIQVTRHGSAISGPSAVFRINSPPQVAVTAPDASGDVSQDFATTIVGDAWGPFTGTEFAVPPSHFTNVSYANPVGSFYGRPIDADPQWFFNLGGHLIDTSIYRSLCFNMMVLGPRDFGAGAVARVFWGSGMGGATLTTSQDIVLDDNLGDTLVNRYCFADLAAVPLEANPNGGQWSGTKSTFRLDPDEFPPVGGCSTPDTCHDVRLDKVTLSPFAQANPGYTIQWTLADSDNASATVALYLDPDTSPLSGNEILIQSSAAGTGSGSFAWPGSTSVNYGTYHVLIVADDGVNSVSQYAGGPLIVGARDGIFRNGFDIP